MEVKPSRPRARHSQPTVPVTVRLTREQFETANRLADEAGIRYQTLLKRVISDGLRSMEFSVRLRDWK